MPAAGDARRYTVANYVMDSVSRLAALALGVLIGWRRPDLVAFRWLAVAGLLQGCVFPYSAPAVAHLPWLDFVSSLSQELSLGAIVFFAINYPDDKPVGWRAILKHFYPWYFGAQVAVALYYYSRLYSGIYEPATSWFFRVDVLVQPALFCGALVLAWRRARGEPRIRLQWILATLGTITIASLMGTLNAMAGFPLPAEVTGLILNVAVLAAIGGFFYAVMRRRIFDFGLAVNRTLVFAIVGAILLGVFQVANRVVSSFLHFDDENKTILLSAILAVAVYLSFGQLKRIVEKLVDRMFFSSWASREEELKRFVAEAKHATDAEALSALLVAAMDRFTGAAGSALYRRQEGGHYRRTMASFDGTPGAVGPNDEAVLAMLAHRKAWRIRESSSSMRAMLAVPMAHRGDLEGFVLLGPRDDREPYRADQIEQLESATHELGLDFHALRIHQLDAEVEAERRTAETLRAQLQTAMAMASRDRPLQG
ncbi:MAG: hypothetical protein ABI881_00870 [Betaproteobacteria bacterium]